MEKEYYHDKEDAYDMKYFFNKEDLEKEKSKIIVLTDDIKYDDIKNHFEEVDINGEEIEDDDTIKNNQEQSQETKEEKDNNNISTNIKKKKKKNK